MTESSAFGFKINGFIVPKNSTSTSSLSIAFNASIIYFELNEIFKLPPSTSVAVTSSFTVPISGDVDDNSTTSFPVLNLITLFPPSRASNDARSIA